jgi:hypothetical protein
MTLRMIVEHRLEDYDRWRKVLDAHRAGQKEYGLTLDWLRRDDADPNHVFFCLLVEDRERAEAFIQLPSSVRAGEESGVLEGSYCYLEDVD